MERGFLHGCEHERTKVSFRGGRDDSTQSQLPAGHAPHGHAEGFGPVPHLGEMNRPETAIHLDQAAASSNVTVPERREAAGPRADRDLGEQQAVGPR